MHQTDMIALRLIENPNDANADEFPPIYIEYLKFCTNVRELKKNVGKAKKRNSIRPHFPALGRIFV